jgi:hypothetical protein
METIETAGNINNLEMNNLNDLELRLIENIELKLIYKLNTKINERDEKINKLNEEICQLKEEKQLKPEIQLEIQPYQKMSIKSIVSDLAHYSIYIYMAYILFNHEPWFLPLILLNIIFFICFDAIFNTLKGFF